MTQPLDTALDRIAALEAELRRLSADVLDLSAAVSSEPDDTDETSSPKPMFASVDAWVDEYFLLVFVRPIGGNIRWCEQWREHAEAVLRLEAMWRSWETLRLDGNLGMATWLTNFADPLLSALTPPQGVFASCRPGRHTHAGTTDGARPN